MKSDLRVGQTYLLFYGSRLCGAFLLLERHIGADAGPRWTALRLIDAKVKLVSEEWLLEDSTESLS